MKKINRILMLAFIVLLSSQAINAQDLISAKDLFIQSRKNKQLVIIFAGKTTDYQKVHIKGAVNIYHKDLYKEGPIESMIKAPEDIAKILGDKGVSNTSPIVVYDKKSSKYAGRLYWILKYLGAEDVKILNGQLVAWKAARKPITKAPTKVKKTTFAVSVKDDLIATKSYVEANMSKAIIIDAQSKEEYEKAHIKGAKNLEYKEVLTEKGTLKSKEALQELFNGIGATKDKEFILYCASSVRAGIMFFALKSVLGYDKVRVYDGALKEWNK